MPNKDNSCFCTPGKVRYFAIIKYLIVKIESRVFVRIALDKTVYA